MGCLSKGNLQLSGKKVENAYYFDIPSLSFKGFQAKELLLPTAQGVEKRLV